MNLKNFSFKVKNKDKFSRTGTIITSRGKIDTPVFMPVGTQATVKAIFIDDLIKSGINFSINVVGEHSKNYMKHFWSGYDADKNPFSEIDHKLTESGVIIMNEAKSTIECKMIQSFQPGDHEIVIAEVAGSYIQKFFLFLLLMRLWFCNSIIFLLYLQNKLHVLLLEAYLFCK